MTVMRFCFVTRLHSGIEAARFYFISQKNMANKYDSHKTGDEEAGGDTNKQDKAAFVFSVPTSASASTSAVSNFRQPLYSPPHYDPNSGGSPHARRLVVMNAGGQDLTNAPYDKLVDEVNFLTSLVLETKHNQFALNKRLKFQRDFRHKGNKAQYTINAEALCSIDEAMYALDMMNYSNVDLYLKEAKGILEERNRMVLMADTSEFGWDTVTAYQTSELALDSDQERRFRRAEELVRTQRKQKAEQSAAVKTRTLCPRRRCVHRNTDAPHS
jgi:hypothetical protein